MVWKSKKKQSHMKNQTTSKEKYIFTWHVLEKNSADNEALFLVMFLQNKRTVFYSFYIRESFMQEILCGVFNEQP